MTYGLLLLSLIVFIIQMVYISYFLAISFARIPNVTIWKRFCLPDIKSTNICGNHHAPHTNGYLQLQNGESQSSVK